MYRETWELVPFAKTGPQKWIATRLKTQRGKVQEQTFEGEDYRNNSKEGHLLNAEENGEIRVGKSRRPSLMSPCNVIAIAQLVRSDCSRWHFPRVLQAASLLIRPCRERWDS